MIKTRTQLFKSFFCTLNDLSDAAALKKNNLSLSDYREIESLFFVDLAQSMRLNNGGKASAKTAVKSVADFFKKNGFTVELGLFGLYTITF